MTPVLCAAPHCRPPGRHGPACKAEPGKPCRGCLPAMAGDGLMLCWRDARRVREDALEAPVLYVELGLALIGGNGAGDGIRSPQPGTGIYLSPSIVAHRSDIRAKLVSWARMIHEERGFALPPDRLGAIGRFVAQSAPWLSAHGAAGDASDELRRLVETGRTLRQASGTRVMPIGRCPEVRDGQACSGTVRAFLRRHDSLFPSALTCDADETHSWDSTQWTKLGRTMNGRAA